MKKEIVVLLMIFVIYLPVNADNFNINDSSNTSLTTGDNSPINNYNYSKLTENEIEQLEAKYNISQREIEVLSQKIHVKTSENDLFKEKLEEKIQELQSLKTIFNQLTEEKITDKENSHSDSFNEKNISIPEMAYIPKGSFIFGCASEVDCNKNDSQFYDIDSFYISKNELTLKQYFDCVNASYCSKEYVIDITPSSFIEHGEKKSSGTEKIEIMDYYKNYPVLLNNFDGAIEYIRWANLIDPSKHYRLPSSVEWEYAARASKKFNFLNSNDIDCTQANYAHTDSLCEHLNHPLPVGSYPPNNFGLYDVLGNVSEYACLPHGYKNMNECTGYVIRGGNYDSSKGGLSFLYIKDALSGKDAGIRIVRGK